MPEQENQRRLNVLNTRCMKRIFKHDRTMHVRNEELSRQVNADTFTTHESPYCPKEQSHQDYLRWRLKDNPKRQIYGSSTKIALVSLECFVFEILSFLNWFSTKSSLPVNGRSVFV